MRALRRAGPHAAFPRASSVHGSLVRPVLSDHQVDLAISLRRGLVFPSRIPRRRLVKLGPDYQGGYARASEALISRSVCCNPTRALPAPGTGLDRKIIIFTFTFLINL